MISERGCTAYIAANGSYNVHLLLVATFESKDGHGLLYYSVFRDAILNKCC